MSKRLFVIVPLYVAFATSLAAAQTAPQTAPQIIPIPAPAPLGHPSTRHPHRRPTPPLRDVRLTGGPLKACAGLRSSAPSSPSMPTASSSISAVSPASPPRPSAATTAAGRFRPPAHRAHRWPLSLRPLLHVRRHRRQALQGPHRLLRFRSSAHSRPGRPEGRLPRRPDGQPAPRRPGHRPQHRLRPRTRSWHRRHRRQNPLPATRRRPGPRLRFRPQRRGPWTSHKIFAGLRDAYRLTGSKAPSRRNQVCRLASRVDVRKISDDQLFQRMLEY